MEIGRLAGGFLKGFANAKRQKEMDEESKKERDARLKLFEVQLQREQRENQAALSQVEARQQLFDRMQGMERMPGTGVGVMNPTAKTPSLLELLADPESSMQLLRSGLVNSKDMMEQSARQQSMGMVQKLIGGGAGGDLELTGLKIGPDGQMMPDLGPPQITSPQTVMTPEGPRLKTFESRTGREVADLGAPKPDTVAPEVAGRISGLVQAQEIATQIRESFVRPDGSIDKQLVLTSFGNMPKSKGRQIRNDIGIAVDAVLRARTGAGVNNAEMKQVVDQFLPGPLDSDEQIKSKLDRLQQFVSGTLDIATLPPSVRKRVEANVKQQLKDQPNVIDFSELPP